MKWTQPVTFLNLNIGEYSEIDHVSSISLRTLKLENDSCVWPIRLRTSHSYLQKNGTEKKNIKAMHGNAMQCTKQILFWSTICYLNLSVFNHFWGTFVTKIICFLLTLWVGKMCNTHQDWWDSTDYRIGFLVWVKAEFTFLYSEC